MDRQTSHSLFIFISRVRSVSTLLPGRQALYGHRSTRMSKWGLLRAGQAVMSWQTRLSKNEHSSCSLKMVSFYPYFLPHEMCSRKGVLRTKLLDPCSSITRLVRPSLTFTEKMAIVEEVPSHPPPRTPASPPPRTLRAPPPRRVRHSPVRLPTTQIRRATARPIPPSVRA